ncbi:MAG: leucine-rich repeat protein [Solobacterium sp.]|nr:leucine-rich repeat protein [Solobacterium sp.]
MVKKLYAVLMSLFMTAAVFPQNIYAEEEPAEETAEEISETEEIEEEEIAEEEIPEEIIGEEVPEEEITAEEPEVIEPVEEVTEEPSEEADPEETETITEPVTEEIPEEIIEEIEPEVTEVPEEEVIPEETVPEETEEPEETVQEPVQTEPETVIEEELPEEPAAPEEIIEEETEEIPEAFEVANGDYTVGSYTYTVSSGKASIKSYNGTASSVTLPTTVTIEGSSYKLTSLGTKAFLGNQYLKSITIPAEYRSIGSAAFRNCTNLSSVTINGDIADCSSSSINNSEGYNTSSNSISIFYNAGTNTGGMTVTFGSGVTRVPAYLFATGYMYSKDVYAHVKKVNLSSKITSIGRDAFYKCYDLETVNFTDATALQTIEPWAFYSTGLRSLKFANKLTTISEAAFSGIENLKSVTLPKSLKTLGKIVFRNCTNLTNVTINGNIADCTKDAVNNSDGYNTSSNQSSVFYNTGTNTDGMTVTFGSAVTRVPAYLFATGYVYSKDVYAHVKKVNLSSGITSIGRGAFDLCYDLNTVNFADAASLQTIEPWAFEATALRSLTFANNLTTIGEGAFYGIKNLKNVTLPKSLKTLGPRVFKNCTYLTNVTINGNITDCNSNAINSSTGYNSSSDLNSIFYNTGTNTNGMTVTFGSGVTRVPAYLFATAYASSQNVYAHVKTVAIPNSVKSIGKYAFFNCYDITSVKIKRNSITIEENAFGNDTKIKAAVYFSGPAHYQMLDYTDNFAYYAPLQPTLSSLTTTEEGVIVKWKAAVGAFSYYVYRKTGTGSYKKIAEVYEQQYFDKAAKTNGKKYTYKIIGVISTKKGKASAAKAVTYNKTTALKKGWVQKNNAWYYVTENYTYQKGWKKISGKWYYFTTSGKMVTSWQKIDGYWYYFTSGGAMVTGWKKIGGNWYWFESDGTMFASSSSYYDASKYINGKYYYFDYDGVCQNP